MVLLHFTCYSFHILFHSPNISKDIPLCSVTILGWPDLQEVFAEREFEKYTGAAARSGHVHGFCDPFTIIETGIPYCVHERQAISSVPGSRDIYTDLGTMFSVCALRKHHVEFASCNKGIKSFL